MEPFILVKANTKAGYEVAEPGDTINLAYPNSTTRRGRVGKRVAQTLTSSPPQQGVVIMKEGEENMTTEIKTPCLLTPNNFSHKAGDGVDSRKKNVSYIHPALQANPGGSQQTYLCNDEMQVRKLTPKECFRLMGFDDSDVDLLMKTECQTPSCTRWLAIPLLSQCWNTYSARFLTAMMKYGYKVG